MKMKLMKVLFFTVVPALILLLFYNIQSPYGKPLEKIDPHIQWQFFEHQFISPQHANTVYGNGQNVTIPHQFRENDSNAKNYGTYVAKLTLPSTYLYRDLSTFIPFEYGSYKLYINSQLISQNGQIGTSDVHYKMEIKPEIGHVKLQQKEVYIVLQMANFSSIRGGFGQPIHIAHYAYPEDKFHNFISSYFFMSGMIFILGIFLMIFALYYPMHPTASLQALICIVLAIRSIFARPFIYSITTLTIPWEWAVKIEAITSILALFLFMRLCYKLFESYVSHKTFYIVYILLSIQFLFILLAKPFVYQQTFLYFFLCYTLYILLLCYLFIKYYRCMSRIDHIQIIAIFFLALTTVIDVINVYQVLGRVMYLHVALLLYVILQIAILSYTYAQKLRQVMTLNEEILTLNASLDEKVRKRTSALIQLNEKLKTLAQKDGLTNIANRFAFDTYLAKYFEDPLYRQKALTLYMIDLDYFKQYNDCYGHQAGDEILQSIVRTIEKKLPKNTMFARYGGEEFAIILEGQEIGENLFGKVLVDTVAEQHFEHFHSPFSIATISVGGYTIYTRNTFTHPKQLIKAADEQLYYAKRTGKNKACHHYEQ